MESSCAKTNPLIHPRIQRVARCQREGGVGYTKGKSATPPTTPREPHVTGAEGGIGVVHDQAHRVLRDLGIEPPIFVMLSLLGVKGFTMGVSDVRFKPGTIDRDSLLLSEVMFDSYDSDVGKVMKPAFDMVWNAAGWSGSRNYEGDKWTGKT